MQTMELIAQAGRGLHGLDYGIILVYMAGVLALGCTIGQGVGGLSTLSLGSLITVIAIVFGSVLTNKFQYYRLDDSFVKSLHQALQDLRLLPR